jgi:membrane protein DedA with SNARE-associated domain
VMKEEGKAAVIPAVLLSVAMLSSCAGAPGAPINPMHSAMVGAGAGAAAGAIAGAGIGAVVGAGVGAVIGAIVGPKASQPTPSATANNRVLPPNPFRPL